MGFTNDAEHPRSEFRPTDMEHLELSTIQIEGMGGSFRAMMRQNNGCDEIDTIDQCTLHRGNLSPNLDVVHFEKRHRRIYVRYVTR